VSLSQRAGNDATQIQVHGDYVVSGVSEATAREIAKAEANIALQEFVLNGRTLAEARIHSFDEVAIGVLHERGLLNAFEDPSFQLTYRKAQIAAASTDEDADHEILANLLAERSLRDVKTSRFAIDRAIDLAGQLDRKTISALCMLWIMGEILPLYGTLTDALQVFDRFLGFVAEEQLPSTGTVVALGEMDCLRLLESSAFHRVPYFQTLVTRGPHWFSAGAPADQLGSLLEELGNIAPRLTQFFIGHDLKPGYVKAQIGGDLGIRRLVRVSGCDPEVTPILIEFLERHQMNSADPNLVSHASRLATERFSNLDRCADWWNSLPPVASLTMTGRALAYTNMKRFDPLNGLGPLWEFLAN
jgi:hypothetical protein